MVSVNYAGRLGNKMIQHAIAFYFSKKNNFQFNSYFEDWPNFFTKSDFFYEKKGVEIFELNDSNYTQYFENKEIEDKHYVFNGYFQNKDFLEKNENEIKSLLNIKYSEISKDSVFLHYRIGDIHNDRRMLPIEYYEEALNKLNFMDGYISSDTIEHKFCQHLIKKYNLHPIQMSPVESIDFGKNFNNIILSEGTFSWWIGFLSRAENVFCNKRDYFWHGDIFFDRWNTLCWDYEIESVYHNYKLKDYKPKKLC